jgi:hypothetical protein
MCQIHPRPNLLKQRALDPLHKTARSKCAQPSQSQSIEMTGVASNSQLLAPKKRAAVSRNELMLHRFSSVNLLEPDLYIGSTLEVKLPILNLKYGCSSIHFEQLIL